MRIKLLILSLLFILFPVDIMAYSDYVIPGGNSIGIDIKSNGILVVGFYKVDGQYNRGNPSLMLGDRIFEVDGHEVSNVGNLIEAIDEYMKDNKVDITFKRNNKLYKTTLNLIYEDNTYKTGLYVKDSISGIGTISYIDPESRIYGALGHEILESNSNALIEVKNGTIFKSIVTSIDRSVAGTPGGKNAKFYSNNIYGNINKNTIKGIYGSYNYNLPNRDLLKVAALNEVNLGSANIYTVLNGEDIEEFNIKITKIDDKNEVKNIYFEVTDEKLLEKTGGIIQGMSGSPIIQNNKIIGAVTHVVVSNPKSGYGISIIKMLEEGEKK